MIDGILDGLAERPSFDVLEEIAWPNPIMGVTDLLDVRATDQVLLHRWTHAITAVDELPLELDLLPAGGMAADAFLAYAGELVDERPRDGRSGRSRQPTRKPGGRPWSGRTGRRTP